MPADRDRAHVGRAGRRGGIRLGDRHEPERRGRDRAARAQPPEASQPSARGPPSACASTGSSRRSCRASRRRTGCSPSFRSRPGACSSPPPRTRGAGRSSSSTPTSCRSTATRLLAPEPPRRRRRRARVGLRGARVRGDRRARARGLDRAADVAGRGERRADRRRRGADARPRRPRRRRGRGSVAPVKHRFITFLTDFGLADDFVGTCHGVMKRHRAGRRDHRHHARNRAAGRAAGRARPAQHAPVHARRRPPRRRRPRRRQRAPAARAPRRGRASCSSARTTGCSFPPPRLRGIESAHELANPAYALEPVSRTFHGRDLFAPAAAHLALGVEPGRARPAARARRARSARPAAGRTSTRTRCDAARALRRSLREHAAQHDARGSRLRSASSRARASSSRSRASATTRPPRARSPTRGRARSSSTRTRTATSRSRSTAAAPPRCSRRTPGSACSLHLERAVTLGPALRALRHGRRRPAAGALAPLPPADAARSSTSSRRSGTSMRGPDVARAGRRGARHAARAAASRARPRHGDGRGRAARRRAVSRGGGRRRRHLRADDRGGAREGGGATRITLRPVADAQQLPFEDGAFDLVTLGNMIPFFDELARVVDARRAMCCSRSPAGPGRRSTSPPERLRAELARGFAEFAELSAGEGRLSRRRVNVRHTERSRSGSTVLDVPSRGGVIRPVLCRDVKRPRRLDRLPEQYFMRLLARVQEEAAAGRRAARRPRPRESRRAAAAARRRGARRERPRADDAPCTATRRSPGCPSCGKRSRSATPTQYGVDARSGARGRDRPGDEVGARRARALRSPSAATRCCCPTRTTRTIPPGSHSPARELELLPLDRRSAATRRASTSRRASDVAAVFLNYPSNPTAAAAPDGAFADAVDVRAGDRRDDHPRLRVRRSRLRRTRAAQLPRRARRARGRRRALLDVEELRDGRLAPRLRRRQRGARRARSTTLQDHVRAGIFTPVQRAGIAALTGPQETVAERVAALRAPPRPRRSPRSATLAAPCEGTFYLWLRLPDGLTPERLLDGAPARRRARRRFRPVGGGLGAPLPRHARRPDRSRPRAPARGPELDPAHMFGRARGSSEAISAVGPFEETRRVARAGIEPATPRFSAVCSTN